jgi:hypothetical protein
MGPWNKSPNPLLRKTITVKTFSDEIKGDNKIIQQHQAML